MPTFHYIAVHAGSAAADAPRRGELVASTPAEVREALRSMGLRPVQLRRTDEEQTATTGSSATKQPDVFAGLDHSIRTLVQGHLRRRRAAAKGAFLDDLATLIETGVPLAEAIDTLARSPAPSSGIRRLLRRLSTHLREGGRFSSSLQEQPGWFDAADVAMVQAGEHAGNLPITLRGLGERHERSGELTRRLVGALAYPMVVLTVGIGVVLFLSNVTLPKLAKVLTDARVPVPPLTSLVISIGQFALHWWPLVILALLATTSALVALHHAIATGRVELPARVRRAVPMALRRSAVAGVLHELACVLRCGVPLVEALRVIAPTAGGLGAASLRRRLVRAADRVEQGDDLGTALDDPLWFGPALRRSVEVGQAGGDLPELLSRLAVAETRRSRVLVDRLASMLEPVAILTLAASIGVVVLAAVQPLVRLQEVVR